MEVRLLNARLQEAQHKKEAVEKQGGGRKLIRDCGRCLTNFNIEAEVQRR